MSYQFWTDEEISIARKMIARGVPKYEIDRRFGRHRGSISSALARRYNPARQKRMADASRDWRNSYGWDGRLRLAHRVVMGDSQ
jgi:hypothetical protein